MKFSFLLALIPLLLFQAAEAGTYEDIAIFKAAAQHPNATGSLSLQGVNMTDNPLGNISPEMWTALLNVTEVSGTSEAHGQTVSTSVISLDSHGAFIANSS